MRTVIVCVTTPQRGLPHQARLLRSNPDKSVYIQYGAESILPWKRYEAWLNADRLIRDWWFQTGRHIGFDRAVFVEWDVVFDMDVDLAIPMEGDLIGKNVMVQGRDDWNWWDQVKQFPAGIRPLAAGIEPLAVVACSRRLLEALFSSAAILKLFDLNVISELRLATAARVSGFEPITCPSLRHVRWDKLDPGVDPSLPGIWHPVKKAL